MKIFLAATSLRPAYGGPAFSVSRLASALTQAGAEVGLWAADQSAASTSMLPRESAVRRLTGPLAQAWAAFGKSDILHDNGLWLPHNHRLATFAARQGIPRVVSTRGMLEPWAMQHKRWKKTIAWRLYQRRDLIRALCHHVTADAEGANLLRLGLGVPVRMIPNGVDVPPLGAERSADRRGNAVRKGQRIALFLGRIYPVKGLPMLVEAWARVRPQGWELRIAGPDEAGHRAQLENAVSAAGLDGVVSFPGPLEGQDKMSAFLDADVFVLPTHSESFGMVVAEALAHGLPVLTTTGAPWPMLLERDCGWRVDTTVDGIEAGLRRATSCDGEVLQAMGARGRQLVAERFGWEHVAKEFLHLYGEMLAR